MLTKKGHVYSIDNSEIPDKHPIELNFFSTHSVEIFS